MRVLLSAVVMLMFVGCTEDEPRVTDLNSESVRLYDIVSSEESGVTFENTITYTKYLNPLVYDTYINGAGVGMLDVNNDGLEDLYFAGNLVDDRLYLNKGNLQFEDITRRAGIQRSETWSTGVAIADVNGDGWDDIYICKYLYDDHTKRANLYYENQGDGTFKEKAAELGINDPGYGIMANFLDFDGDNDLDLYIANQPPSSLYERPKLKGKTDYRYTDRLYRNDGNTFSDVTGPAGITNYTYSLSATAGDLNNDGLVDIYVACDYEEPDIMYINQGDGTFKNVVHEALNHMSNFSMGADIADINNDGWLDVFTADMVAEDNFRNKTNMSGMNPEKFWNLANNGYHYQYMFNAMHLNNGNGTFSDVAQLAGVSHTDWSWAALFVDMDQDGFKDLFVSNGQAKEMRNKDFEIQRVKIMAENHPEDMHDLLLELALMAPEKKLSNYAYRNNGDLTFTNLASEWNLDVPTWSQGAAYGDLDNDGDLDLVINNINQAAQIYRSRANDERLNNYVVVDIDGPQGNSRGLQARVEVISGDVKQTAELTPFRGYLSSMQRRLHFGLGAHNVIDKLVVTWQDGKVVEKQGVKANRKISIAYAEATGNSIRQTQKSLFVEEKTDESLHHSENVYDDYQREILLPYQMSTLGPVIAHADVNGDDLEDFYLGGSVNFSGQLFVQASNGGFSMKSNPAFDLDRRSEDGGAAFLDIDSDGDMDLLVASGGNEYDAGDSAYRDRLYINDGAGKFSKASLPDLRTSASVVLPLDYDGDGDQDVFIGGRQVPGKYGFVPTSTLLRNDNGQFRNVSGSLPDGGAMGMVTDAAWVSTNTDTKQLILVGEWMPVMMLSWINDRFVAEENASLANTRGLWNRIAVDDIDGDGDQDIVAGNMGTNMRYDASPETPFKLYVDDFDGNGTHDVYLGYYGKDGQCYPVRGRQCSSQQMPFVKEKFESYEVFASATIDEVLAGRLDDDSHQQYAEMFESGIFVNDGSGQFTFKAFGNAAQVAPVFGIAIEDFNNDGKKDIFVAGNYFNREVETTRSDAGIGCLMLATENGDFKEVHPSKSGIVANKDARDVLLLRSPGVTRVAIINNNDAMQFYRLASD